MEGAEDASLEPAIGWLAQTILGTLQNKKLHAWIQQADIEDDVGRLNSEVQRAEMVVGAVRGRGAGNKPLSRSLGRLKKLLYDTDDVVDELDYYMLQEQAQGVTCDNPESMHGTEQVYKKSKQGGAGILRSMLWKDFTVTKWKKGSVCEAKCNRCGYEPLKCASANGTSCLRNHLKSRTCTMRAEELRISSRTKHCTEIVPPAGVGDLSSRKRIVTKKKVTEESTEGGDPSSRKCRKRRSGGVSTAVCDLSGRGRNEDSTAVSGSSSRKRKADDEPTPITAPNTQSHWNKRELCKRVSVISRQLKESLEEVSQILKLCGSDFTSSSNQHQSTTADQLVRTSSVLPRKVYGRISEKNFIMKLIVEGRSDSKIVLPIVGIAGVGKTTLAQLIYNNPDLETQFDHMMWVWVSNKFDEVRLTKEMLYYVTQERHEGSFAHLQEILKSHVKSKRVLLILDDVWDDVSDCQWNQLLAPFKSGNANRNVIIVTTRTLSVAKLIGTARPIKLGALQIDDLWLLLKSCAFGDQNSNVAGNLNSVGRQISDKLKGNPLAAVTAGVLLRNRLTVDHWSNILKNEKWKSLGIRGGIMAALKLSYDQLPYHLQQCLLYCSIFPNKYRFLGKDLVCIWISQGYVKSTDLSKRLEETGWEYLTDLVNLGFFEQVEEKEEEEEEEPSLGSQIWYSMCGLMHDFARMVSRTECATMDGLQCNEMLPTVRHLSIVTYSIYSEDHYGNIPRNEKFEEYLRNKVASASTLRTLVLLGQYDSFLFELFRDILQKAQNLRLLLISATPADFISYQRILPNHVHLRYLKRMSDELGGASPLVSNKLCHLQVLDVGSNTDPIEPDWMHNLVSLRHLIAEKGLYSSIAAIGSMTSLQELHDFKVQASSGFEISQLQSMNALVELGVSQLHNVKTREEASEAELRNKEHLEKLHLSWKDSLSQEEYGNDASSESSADNSMELSQMDDNGPSSEPFTDTTREVLEALEPHMALKHLQISGYNGTTSPTWLASKISLTSLQTLGLDSCGEWEVLPSLKMFPFLTKLKLSNLCKVIEVLVPPLEELHLVEMPKLERCSCTSTRALNSTLRALQIKNCHALKAFDLIENNQFKIEQGLWLPRLRRLILHDCPNLEMLKPLPPSTTLSSLLISGVSALPNMEGSSSGRLHIGYLDDFDGNLEDVEDKDESLDESCDDLRILDDKILAFHNLRSLKLMRIDGCQNLTSISFKGFGQLVSLKSLQICRCEKLFSSDVMPVHIDEYVTTENCKAFPSLENLSIKSCGITGTWLSLMLQHAPNLEELILVKCPCITTLLLAEEGENLDDALTGLAEDRILQIPANLISSLKKITICDCSCLTFSGNKGGFSLFTSLKELNITECSKLLFSLVHKERNHDSVNGRWLLPHSLEELIISNCSLETLQPCFPSRFTSLRKLKVWRSTGLLSLQLHSCTTLEELRIGNCGSLTTIEGLIFLGSLKHLELYGNPMLLSCFENLSRPGSKLCPWLETLVIDDPCVLTTPFCKNLTILHRLQLHSLVLTPEQGRKLVLLKSLQELQFSNCHGLVNLPTGLHTFPSLKILKIDWCSGISSLPKTGLPRSLEELEIIHCSKELNDECRLLATDRLTVKIDEY